MRNVVFVAPFPMETTLRFARALRGLANVRLIGIWQKLPGPPDNKIFDELVLVDDALDAQRIADACKGIIGRFGKIDQLIGILEHLQVPLAEVRAHFGIPGEDPRTALQFRDKATMKEVLRRHGVPCARHRTITAAQHAWEFVAQVGFPIVLKPPAGAGCVETWRVDSKEALESALRATNPSPARPTLAEEFLIGEEYSFETLTLNGTPLFHSISRYLPTPLEVMRHPWMQWLCVLPRDISGPQFDVTRATGLAALKALGCGTAMTHMEWFRRVDGSVAVGEVAMRPPGANIVRMTGLAYDTDMYRAWARLVVDGAFDGPWERKYAVGCAFLRGAGNGRIARVRGLDEAQRAVGALVVDAQLPRIGAHKSSSYEGDGYAIVRHPDTAVVMDALKTIIQTVQIDYA